MTTKNRKIKKGDKVRTVVNVGLISCPKGSVGTIDEINWCTWDYRVDFGNIRLGFNKEELELLCKI